VKLPHERFDYSAITSRRPWKLPKGARVAVWTIVNIEEWSIEKACRVNTCPRPGRGRHARRAQLGLARVRMRIGFWRLHEALTKRNDPGDDGHQRPRLRVVSAVARAMLDAGWEFMGPRRRPGGDAPAPRSTRRDRRGRPPHREIHGQEAKGWLGPGLTETWETLDLLARPASPTCPTG